MTDKQYMEVALSLAKKGDRFINPNPMVGAVIVKDGEIIGQGYHEKYGGLHAERNALVNCSVSPKNATLYVTLEPCCHHGKTPPCTDAIIESGIKKVVIGVKDPNLVVAGKGIEILKYHGLDVVVGVLENECCDVNKVFFHYAKTKTPYVVMKYAMTLDGKIATYTGASKWITGEAARQNVHLERCRYSAIMVGVGTIISDNPMLTCRVVDGINPVRIICDTNLRTPLDTQIIKTAKNISTIIATSCLDDKKIRQYTDKGCKIIKVSSKHGYVDLNELMTELGKEKIDSILLEGGGTLNWTALQSGIVNMVKAYISPKILGGATAKTPVAGFGVHHPDCGFLLSKKKITQLGEDILIEGEVIQPCLQE